MLTRSITLAATAAAGVFGAMAILPDTPAEAQRRGEKTLIVYGNDKCPTSNGEEIVVCYRLDENERYRIPPELRGEGNITGAGNWAERVKSIEYVGAAGTDSCSPVGAGGATGCARQMFAKAREERRQEGKPVGIAPF